MALHGSMNSCRLLILLAKPCQANTHCLDALNTNIAVSFTASHALCVVLSLALVREEKKALAPSGVHGSFARTLHGYR